MKSVLFVVVAMVVGCAGQDLHEVGACGSGWNPTYAGCEHACADFTTAAPMGSDVANMCFATDQRDNTIYDCMFGTIVIDGVRGCCTPNRVGSGAVGDVRFFECN